MKTTDLRPFSRELFIRPGDAWVFPMKFRQLINNVPVPLDVSNYMIGADVSQWQENGGFWKFFAKIERTGKNINQNSNGNYIYFDYSDLSNSSIIFAADWLLPGDATLSEGIYKVDFTYSSSLYFQKSFCTYKIHVTESIRDEDVPLMDGIEYMLLMVPEETVIYINNTIINNNFL